MANDLPLTQGAALAVLAERTASPVFQMVKAWALQVPTSFGAGWLLATKNIPGSAFAVFVTCLVISIDILSRRKVFSWGASLGLASVLTLAVILPYAAAARTKKDFLFPGGLGLAALICLASSSFGELADKITRNDSIRATLITLMYVMISGSIGWHGAKAKKEPLHKGWAVYSTMLLVLLTFFDASSQLNSRPATESPVQ